MNLKLKALLIAISIPTFMFVFVYTLVFYPAYMLILFGISLVYGLYRLALQLLEEQEQRKPKNK